MIANYHTHTRWCRHAQGEIEDYIKEAVAKGLEEIAITDHVPHRPNFDLRRMQWEEFEPFNRELDEMVAKYAHQIRVIKGFECEYYPNAMEDYRRFRDVYGYQVFVLGHHTSCDRSVDNFDAVSREHLRLYRDEVIEGLHTGMFTFLAHPDVILSSYGPTDDFVLEMLGDIFAVCERLDIPVELNANGMRDHRRYPDRKVWEHARNYRLRVLINSDAHYVEHVCDKGVADTEALAKELGIVITPKLLLP